LLPALNLATSSSRTGFAYPTFERALAPA